MKVFVTGATGVIGRPAVERLVAAGHDVSALSRSAEKDAALEAAGVRPVRVDLFDVEALTTAFAGHDVVCNLATNIPPLTKAARRKAWATNDRIRTEGSAAVATAARTAAVSRVVQESITFPYEDRGDGWIDEDVPRPDSPLTASVATAEANAVAFGTGGAEAVVLRFAQFYAAGSSHTDASLAALRRGVNPFLGKPEGYWSFIHADDAASAVVAAVDATPGTYNIAETEPATRADVAAAVIAALGKRRARSVPAGLVSTVNPGSETLMRSHRISSERFRTATGWAPSWPTATDGWARIAAATSSPRS